MRWKTIRARQVKINSSLPRHLIYRNTNNDCLTKSLFVSKNHCKLLSKIKSIKVVFKYNLPVQKMNRIFGEFS